jgi:tripeptidyl-peptidase-1
MKSSILLLLGAAAAVIARPAPHEYVVHERRDYIPSSWIQSKKLDGSTTLPVRIGLTQSNLDRGHDLLMEMYAATRRLSIM